MFVRMHAHSPVHVSADLCRFGLALGAVPDAGIHAARSGCRRGRGCEEVFCAICARRPDAEGCCSQPDLCGPDAQAVLDCALPGCLRRSPIVSQMFYYAFDGTSGGISLSNLLTGLVLFTRGSPVERSKRLPRRTGTWPQ